MIRLPDIPGLNPQSIDAPAMRPGAAAAPAAGLGQLAESIASVSDQFHDYAIKLQRIDNARVLSEKRRALADSYAAFQNELATDPDPTSRIDKTRSFFATAKDQLGTEELPPETQLALNDHFENFATQAVIRQAEDSLRLGVQRGRMALQNDLDAAIRAGDPAMATASLAEHEAAGTIFPEERIKIENNFNREIKARAISSMIQQDPFAAQDELARSDFSQRHPELAPEDIDQLQRQAAVASRLAIAGDIDTIQDGIATGEIKSPDEIDGMAGHIRPAAREELKGTLERRQSELQQTWLRRPEVQARLIGEANSAISEYDPQNPESYDEGLARIHGLIDQVAPGAVRDELTRRIRDVREGKQTARKGTLDRAVAALEDSFKNGGFGGGKIDDGERTLPVSRAIADGFLRDPAKLASLGFSRDQLAGMETLVSEELKHAAKSDSWKGLGDAAKAAREAEIADKTRAEWFRQNWNLRDTSAKPTDPAVVSISEAIANGSTSAKWQDDQAAARAAMEKQTAQERKGKAIQRLIEWHQDTPNATETQLEEKLFEYAGEETRKAFLSSKVTAPPRRGGESLALILPAPLAKHADTFEEAGRIYGVNPLLLAAISMNETGNGTSSAFRNKNNAMGISDATGPIHIDSVATSIKRMARLLGSTSGGPYRNARTLAEVAAIYAPPGAVNDPRGLNSGWLQAVSRNFRALGGDPSAPIK